jgi:hypothetical protein
MDDVKRRACLAFIACAAASIAGPARASAQEPASQDGAPAKNWSLALFTKEGYHSMTLRGTEVRQVSEDRIDVVDINITVFSGDASARIDKIILSPSASYFPRENRASGAQSVRVIMVDDGAEITGEDWTCDEVGKKVSIRRHAHVTFRQQLPDILR